MAGQAAQHMLAEARRHLGLVVELLVELGLARQRAGAVNAGAPFGPVEVAAELAHVVLAQHIVDGN